MRLRTLLVTALIATGVAATAPAAQAAPAALAAGTALTFGTATRCVGGFNAVGDNVPYLLAAGGCGAAGSQVRGPGQVLVGTVAGSPFPNPAYTLVRVTNLAGWTPTPAVSRQGTGASVPVTGSTEAPVGATVCMSSPSSGWQCGTITAKNLTIRFPDGSTLTGITRTTLCVQPGDHGAPVVSGGQAQGHIAGGSSSGSCAGYFQPIRPILAQLGLTLLTA